MRHTYLDVPIATYSPLNAFTYPPDYNCTVYGSTFEFSQAELADRVSKSRSAITNSLRLLDLPEAVQELSPATMEELLELVAIHARETHGIADVTPDFLDDVKQAVQDVCTTGLNLFRVLVVYLSPVLPKLAADGRKLPQ